jgi:hypothetical protein
MKKTTVFLLVITLMALTLIAASSQKEKVGERLFFDIGGGDMSYEASHPFHIAHGWRSEIGKSGKTTAKGGLRLEFDTNEVTEDFIEYFRLEEGDTVYIQKWFVFNYPVGMTDTHTFDFYYSNVCSFWLGQDLPFDPDVTYCENPNEILEFKLKSWTVHFEPPY